MHRPIGQQFVEYIKNPFTGNGPSVKYNESVWDVIGPSLWPTLLLVGTATIIATIIGVWLGIRSGWNRGERFDVVSTNTTLVLYSMPEFWFGMIMLIVFAVGIGPIPGMFPTGGLSDPGVDTSSPAGWVNVAWHLVLPVTTLAVIYLAEYSLIMRASIIPTVRNLYMAKLISECFKVPDGNYGAYAGGLNRLPEADRAWLPQKKDGSGVNVFGIFVCVKMAGNFELAGLQRVMEATLKADQALVTTGLDHRLILHRLIAEVAAARKGTSKPPPSRR